MTGYLSLTGSIAPWWLARRNEFSSLHALLVVYTVQAFPPVFNSRTACSVSWLRGSLCLT